MPPNEILVSSKKHFKVYIDRIHKLLYESDEKDKDNNLVPKFTTVILRGLGGLGVQKVCDLAL